jgi:flagellar biosynthesis component FlhA
MDKLGLKKRILEESRSNQQLLRDDLRQSGQEKVESANHNEDDELTNRFESTREEVMDEISLVTPQADVAQVQLQLLERMEAETLHGQVKSGSVVLTDQQNLFVSTSLPLFEVEGKPYLGVSTDSPIYHAMKDKKKGDSFTLNGVAYHIEDVF